VERRQGLAVRLELRAGLVPGLRQGVELLARAVAARYKLSQGSAADLTEALSGALRSVGELVSVHVIPRPHDSIEEGLPLGRAGSRAID